MLLTFYTGFQCYLFKYVFGINKLVKVYMSHQYLRCKFTYVYINN